MTINCKEKSPRLLEQTMGDTSKISYSSYPDRDKIVNWQKLEVAGHAGFDH